MKIDFSSVEASNGGFIQKALMPMPFDNECCVLKKCCKAYKKKGKHCRKCPKL